MSHTAKTILLLGAMALAAHAAQEDRGPGFPFGMLHKSCDKILSWAHDREFIITEDLKLGYSKISVSWFGGVRTSKPKGTIDPLSVENIEIQRGDDGAIVKLTFNELKKEGKRYHLEAATGKEKSKAGALENIVEFFENADVEIHELEPAPENLVQVQVVEVQIKPKSKAKSTRIMIKVGDTFEAYYKVILPKGDIERRLLGGFCRLVREAKGDFILPADKIYIGAVPSVIRNQLYEALTQFHRTKNLREDWDGSNTIPRNVWGNDSRAVRWNFFSHHDFAEATELVVSQH